MPTEKYECSNCHKEFYECNRNKIRHFNDTGRIYCSEVCGKVGKGKVISIKLKKPPRTYICSECGNVFDSTNKYVYRRFKKTGRCYCSKECSRKYFGRSISAILTKKPMAYTCSECGNEFKMKNKARQLHFKKTGKVYCSDKCAKINMLSALSDLGGGRGKGRMPTKAQAILAGLLCWEMEHIVTTGIKMLNNPLCLPTSYSIDIANSDLKIAIEVDGYHHYQAAFKEKDAKKDMFLSSIGWTVIRFFNKEVLDNPEKCVNIVIEAIKNNGN